jgi:nicotinate phosphoribosyltransferase
MVDAEARSDGEDDTVIETDNRERETRYALSDAILRGRTADVYFLHAREILEAEGAAPRVAMEVFASRSGILCGMREVVELLRRGCTSPCEVHAVEEGAAIDAGEVVLQIVGTYSAFGIYETALLGILAHETGWATAARRCVDAAGEIPILHFGARHVHPEVAGRLEYAAILGGCVGCATPLGAELAGIEPSGTIPHAFILCMGDTVEAMRAFERHVDPGVKRIALVDTFKDEAEESLRVADALGDRLWGVRLDTPAERGRVTPELVHEVRARLDQAGHGHVRIVVSGGVDVAGIRAFREARAPIDAFGIGHAISSAAPIDFTADIKEIEGRPVAKRGRIPGRTENPRLQSVL